MGSKAPLKLPIIDFSELNKQNAGSFLWDTVKAQVFKAFQEFGCFEASFAGISPELRQSIFSSLEKLFDLPLETKSSYVLEKTFAAYLGQLKDIPIYESLGIDTEQVESFTNLMWPHGNPEFCKSIQNYSQKVSEIDEMVRRMVLESLGLEKYIDQHLQLTTSHLRVMKYRAPEKDEPNIGMVAHADMNIVTILHQNEIGGLEVQTKNEEWIEVKYSPNSFIVLAGESFNAWTNGRLHAAFHRVVMTENRARYSLGLFSIPDYGIVIKAPEEMVDEDHPLLYKPFDYGEFRKFTKSKENVMLKFPLKTYCGVCN